MLCHRLICHSLQTIQDLSCRLQIVLEKLKQEIKEEELTKVKNQAQSSHVFGEIEVMNRAMNLAFASLSGDAGLVNKEADLIASVTKEELVSAAKNILREENCNVLYYLKEN